MKQHRAGLELIRVGIAADLELPGSEQGRRVDGRHHGKDRITTRRRPASRR